MTVFSQMVPEDQYRNGSSLRPSERNQWVLKKEIGLAERKKGRPQVAPVMNRYLDSAARHVQQDAPPASARARLGPAGP